MSDTEDRAGLYVLGALNAEEMRAVRADAERDPRWPRKSSPGNAA